MKLNKKFKVLAIGAALVLSIGAVGCSKQEEAPKEEAKQEQAKKFKVLAIGAALVLSIGAVGCSKQEEAPKEEAKQEQAKAEVKTIKGDEVVEAMKDANTVVIDARDASEYEAGHIKGALNVFVDEAESKLGDLEQYKDKKVIVYCNSGNKSGKLAQFLVDNGFTDVSNADGVKQYEYELVQGKEEPKAEVKTMKGDEVVEAMKDTANTVVTDVSNADGVKQYEYELVQGKEEPKAEVKTMKGDEVVEAMKDTANTVVIDVSNADGVKQYEYELVQGKEEPKAEVKTMKGDEVVEAMKDTANTVVIDARDAKDFAKGHIDGAINVFVDEAKDKLGELEQYKDKKVIVAKGHIDGAINVFVDEAKDKLGELEQYKDKKVIVYCNSGNKSGKLAQLLVDNGFTDVYNADGVKQYEYNLVKGE